MAVMIRIFRTPAQSNADENNRRQHLIPFILCASCFCPYHLSIPEG